MTESLTGNTQAEINAENGWTKMVEENGRRMRDFALAAIFFSVEFGPYTAETEVRGKIAQSGHRLDHVRSG